MGNGREACNFLQLPQRPKVWDGFWSWIASARPRLCRNPEPSWILHFRIRQQLQEKCRTPMHFLSSWALYLEKWTSDPILPDHFIWIKCPGRMGNAWEGCENEGFGSPPPPPPPSWPLPRPLLRHHRQIAAKSSNRKKHATLSNVSHVPWPLYLDKVVREDGVRFPHFRIKCLIRTGNAWERCNFPQLQHCPKVWYGFWPRIASARPRLCWNSEPGRILHSRIMQQLREKCNTPMHFRSSLS